MSNPQQQIDKLDDELVLNSLTRKQINRKRKQIRKVKCNTFRKEHKNILRILDVAVVLMILMNFGALSITNALVVKEDPDGEFYEANPVTAEIYDFEELPKGHVVNGESQQNPGEIIMTKMFIVFISWTILISLYIYARSKISEIEELYYLIFYMLFYFIAMGYDFINDLGYYIGVKLWGT